MRDKVNLPGTGTGPSRANPCMREEGTHRLLATREEGRREKARKRRKERRTKVRGTVVSVAVGERVCGIVAVEDGFCYWFVAMIIGATWLFEWSGGFCCCLVGRDGW